MLFIQTCCKICDYSLETQITKKNFMFFSPPYKSEWEEREFREQKDKKKVILQKQKAMKDR